jgi:exodeoxyribonuclease-3
MISLVHETGGAKPEFPDISMQGRKDMKIASFNANGIRARLSITLQWLGKEAPDILCIQETKVQDPDFPQTPFNERGYHCSFKGEKGYNGVAILSKTKPESVRIGFGNQDEFQEARLIMCRINGIPIVNTYVPQGQDPGSDRFTHKLNWLKRLKEYFETHFKPDHPLIWTGDFNVAPAPIDVYDPKKLLGSVGYHPEEHKTLQYVKDWGFVDVFRKHNSEAKQYTFWDYRIPNSVKHGLGWRVDHIWATESAAKKSKNAWIDKEPRLMQRPSDHTFIVGEFDI